MVCVYLNSNNGMENYKTPRFVIFVLASFILLCAHKAPHVMVRTEGSFPRRSYLGASYCSSAETLFRSTKIEKKTIEFVATHFSLVFGWFFLSARETVFVIVRIESFLWRPCGCWLLSVPHLRPSLTPQEMEKALQWRFNQRRCCSVGS